MRVRDLPSPLPPEWIGFEYVAGFDDRIGVESEEFEIGEVLEACGAEYDLVLVRAVDRRHVDRVSTHQLRPLTIAAREFVAEVDEMPDVWVHVG